MDIFRLAIVSFAFLGCSPVAPGTAGTLGGVLIAWTLSGTAWFPVWTLLVCLGLYAVGRALGPWAEAHAGKKDPGIFVLDDVVAGVYGLVFVVLPARLLIDARWVIGI